MQISNFKIISNKLIARDVYELILSGNVPSITPGQFVNIKLPGFYLRRPISICDWNEEKGSLSLIYKVVGEGTELLSKIQPCHSLELLLPLGNGFDTSLASEHTLICGGGVGVPPLIGLAKKLIAEGKTPSVVLGFNTKDEIFGVDKFRELGIEPKITSVDGSFGIEGYVTAALDKKHGIDFDYIFSCGPVAMLKALYNFEPENKAKKIGGQYSFEARMACGFGACMGCSCITKEGYKRICKDGPVLKKEEIVW